MRGMCGKKKYTLRHELIFSALQLQRFKQNGRALRIPNSKRRLLHKYWQNYAKPGNVHILTLCTSSDELVTLHGVPLNMHRYILQRVLRESGKSARRSSFLELSKQTKSWRQTDFNKADWWSYNRQFFANPGRTFAVFDLSELTKANKKTAVRRKTSARPTIVMLTVLCEPG